MKLFVKACTPETQKAHCAVIGVFDSRTVPDSVGHVDKAMGGALKKRLSRGDVTGRKNRVATLFEPEGLACERLMVVGFGKRSKLELGDYRRICRRAAEAVKSSTCRDVYLWLPEIEVRGADVEQTSRHLAEALLEAWYSFDELKSNSGSEKPPKRVTICVADKRHLSKARAGVRTGQAVGNGTRVARRLGDLPGNICTPGYLAGEARKLQRSHNLKVTVLDEKQMKQLGMGALLSVARGSRQPPKLIIMEYRGGKKTDAPIALVGKGLTFDAGGISIKPAAGMDEMKYDMCGATSVFGALVAAAELSLPINIVGVVPSSENLPDGNANKPGDIVTSMSGQTIEILNTDAEGRLILCDALTYTARYKPNVVIDIATLTGACVVALGHHASGLMANNQRLADQLMEAGKRSLDRVWQLPLWEDYQSSLDSNFADMANVGGRSAGAITAGSFLSRFTRSFKWAHLDIAGTAWMSGGKEKGSTGRVVPLLSQYLIDRSPKRR
ncbi:MAG: leucyl aminopeptidase [Gammaproteobacteria bacterium]|nr:leucyl aminopeptidase [Gammaproteobacteria bacterium]